MGKIPVKLQLDFESNFSSNLFHSYNSIMISSVTNSLGSITVENLRMVPLNSICNCYNQLHITKKGAFVDWTSTNLPD